MILCYTPLAWGETTPETTPAETKPSEIQIVLVPKLEATLSSQLAARINEIHIDDGEAFQQGDVLLKFDCAVLETEFRKAEAEHMAAEKKVIANKRLDELNSISKLDVQVSEADFAKAKAEKERIGEMLKYCVVKAPFSGRVGEVFVNLFESVPEGKPLLSIISDQSLKIEMFVPSHWLSWLKRGTKFQVKIDETRQTYPAVVKTLGANVDSVSQSLKIIAVLDGEFPELISGMAGQALFEVPQQP